MSVPVAASWQRSGRLLVAGLLPLAAVACAGSGERLDGTPDAPTADASGAPAIDARRARIPILFVHGVNGSAADFAAMIARFEARGWPSGSLVARTFDDPSWGCNVDNAATLATWVSELQAATGAPQIDVVAHSMGTLSSRFFMKNLGGTTHTRTYATLGGMHHGLATSCSPDFPGKPCIWSEICSSGAYVAQLDAAPATPGPTRWISIYGSADDVVPASSSILAGAENLRVEGADHMGLLEEQPTFDVLAPMLE